MNKHLHPVNDINSIAPFEGLFLLDAVKNNVVHKMTYIDKGLAFSKLGRGRSIFHTLESIKPSYEASEKTNLTLVKRDKRST